MRNQSFENIFHALILAQRVNADDIFRNVVDRQVLHGWDFNL